MLARVSAIESYRRWRLDEESTDADLITAITDHEPTPAMLAGTAFHAALEAAQPGDASSVLMSGKYRFNLLIDVEVALPKQREMRASGCYGPLTVTGKFDALHGLTIIDHKTTARFDAEKYIAGCQWRFYLDIFGCDKFRWNVFEMKESGPLTYDVFAFHQLEQMRYPDMHADCTRLARDFYGTVSRVIPNYQSNLKAA